MMITTVPAIVIALAVFALVGILTPPTSQEQSSDMMHYLHATFNITPWTLLIPCATILLLVMKLGLYYNTCAQHAVGCHRHIPVPAVAVIDD